MHHNHARTLPLTDTHSLCGQRGQFAYIRMHTQMRCAHMQEVSALDKGRLVQFEEEQYESIGAMEAEVVCLCACVLVYVCVRMYVCMLVYERTDAMMPQFMYA
jgi:hypothetical protein